MSNIDWAHIRAVMPMEKTPEDKKRRMAMFKQFDPNNNGYLSLAECDKGVRDVLRLPEIFNLKPVIMRAFQMAKSMNDGKNKKGSHGPDYIEFCEFRVFLWSLRQYLELWVCFDEIDTSDDRRVEFDEFVKAIPLLERWGIKISDPRATFAEIDKNGGGILTFDEFAAWALEKGLDRDDDDD